MGSGAHDEARSGSGRDADGNIHTPGAMHIGLLHIWLGAITLGADTGWVLTLGAMHLWLGASLSSGDLHRGLCEHASS